MGIHFRISAASLKTYTLLTARYSSTITQREGIVSCPRQKWLGKRAECHVIRTLATLLLLLYVSAPNNKPLDCSEKANVKRTRRCYVLVHRLNYVLHTLKSTNTSREIEQRRSKTFEKGCAVSTQKLHLRLFDF
jgi:hypothetical protein